MDWMNIVLLAKSEVLRFRRLAIVLTLAHLALLRGAAAFVDLFVASQVSIAMGVLLYGGLGLALGLYQMGTHRPLGRWTYLIHRPLRPSQILCALTGAAALLLTCVLALPLLAITVYSDLMTSQWIDARHYQLAPFALGLAFSTYLVGAFMMLSASRTAFLAVSLLTLFMTTHAAGAWIFVPLAAVIGWLAFMVHTAFKPDLTTHIRRPTAVVANAIPMAYAFLGCLSFVGLLLYSTAVAFQEHGWRSFAAHAWNDYFPMGTVDRVGYLDPTETLAHGLRDPAATPELETQRRLLLGQVDLAEVYGVDLAFLEFPVRHQPMFMDRWTVLDDPEQEVQWTFSHDQGLFHGRRHRGGQAVGWLGTSGPLGAVPPQDVEAEERFTSVPYVMGRFIVTPSQLYEFDPRRQTVDLRYALAGDERFVGPPTVQATAVTVLTDQRLLLFEPRDFNVGSGRPKGLLETITTIPLEGAVSNLRRIDLAELIDSYLVSMVFGTESSRGHAPARQLLLDATFDGEWTILAREELGQGVPAVVRHRTFVASPVLSRAHDAAWGLIEAGQPNRFPVGHALAQPVPRSVALAAAFVALLSAALTYWLTTWRRLDGRQRLGWTALAFVLGLPGLLTCVFSTARSERVASRPTDAHRQAIVGGLANSQGVG